MADKPVTIDVQNDLIQVRPDPVKVSVSGGEQVVWQIVQDYDFDVEFVKDEPFVARQFHGHKGTPAKSGGANKGTENHDYKYTVKVPGKRPLDPTVRPTP